MINQLVEQLDLIPVLDEPAVQRIKQYIRVKFPTDSSNKHASTLANTVHRVVDRELVEFSPALRNSIRLQAIETALDKGSFSLNAGDLFQACVEVLPHQADTQLVDWLNRQLRHPGLSEVTPVQLDSFRGRLDNPFDYQITTDNQLTIDSTVTTYRPLTIGLILAAVMFSILVLISQPELYSPAIGVTPTADRVNQLPSNQLPSFLKYKEVNVSKLKAYLQSKDSLLAGEPYFTAVIDSSREFNVNPLVLFAVAGHEQGFVPRKGQNSYRIINNPFNVFHSWKEYNTDIRDSSRIAARTIVHAAEGRPEDVNTFQWLNKRYAEDVNWWKGVNSIYSDLEKFQ